MMAGFEPAGVLVEILNADGTMARRPELEVFAQTHGLKMGSIEALIRYRLETEHTVERIESRPIDTPAGVFLMHVYRDRVDHQLHFALQKGTAERDRPSLVRVHTRNTLADALHWLRGDFGVPSLDALHRIAEAGHGALVVLGDAESSETVLARLRQEPLPDTQKRHPASAGWRQNGTGSQILADLGYGKLRVLGTARKQVGMAGFGLEIVENVPVANG
jgi:3,4-dihydroxy 2-butanone 4-phosphate synthase/GTP cyclohydrolase II